MFRTSTLICLEQPAQIGPSTSHRENFGSSLFYFILFFSCEGHWVNCPLTFVLIKEKKVYMISYRLQDSIVKTLEIKKYS